MRSSTGQGKNKVGYESSTGQGKHKVGYEEQHRTMREQSRLRGVAQDKVRTK